MRSVPIRPIGVCIDGPPAFGASGQIDPGWVEQFRAATLETGFVVMRGVDWTPDAFGAFACCLGTPEGADFVRRGNAFGGVDPDCRSAADSGLTVLSNVAGDGSVLAPDSARMHVLKANERWHSDSSFMENPSSLSLLWAARVPEEGGDTSFASMALGWKEMADADRSRFLGRFAVHDWSESVRELGGSLPGAVEDSRPTGAVHPLVTIHPETNRGSFFVSGHAQRIEGLDAEQSKRELDVLLRWLTRPERVYRHQWRQGDLLVWDNRQMLHRAHGFPPDKPRIMHRIALTGSKPIALTRSENLTTSGARSLGQT